MTHDLRAVAIVDNFFTIIETQRGRDTRAIIGEDSVVSAGCVVGAEAKEGENSLIALVGQHTELPENFVVNPGDQIDGDMLRLERSLDV